jgi:antitoxin component YwqK of YwqJK toxin-antitoxin module
MLREIKTNTHHYFVDENNLKQGEYKFYHENGQLSIHTFYQNGKCHGEFKSYYGNGQLWEHAFYLNNNLHGEYKRYHKNGLYIHTFYLNGKLHGEYESYHDNGVIEYATFYCQGKNLEVNSNSLTEKDKVYIMMSGRLPEKKI